MLYLLLYIFCSAAMALVLKFVHSDTGNRYGIILGNYLTCIVIAFLMLPQKSALAAPGGTTLLCSGIAGFLYVLSLVIMQTSLRINGATLTTAFSKLGLLVTLAVSILLFGERPGALQGLGIALVAGSMVLIHAEKEGGQNAAGSFPLLLIMLVTSGSSDVMAKVFEQVGSRSEDGLYLFFLFFTAAMLTSGLALLEYRKTGKRILLRELAAGIALGIPNYFSSMLLLRALTKLPAFIVYPSCSTGTILLVMIASAFLFKERIGRRQLLGLLLILAALVLLNL